MKYPKAMKVTSEKEARAMCAAIRTAAEGPDAAQLRKTRTDDGDISQGSELVARLTKLETATGNLPAFNRARLDMHYWACQWRLHAIKEALACFEEEV